MKKFILMAIAALMSIGASAQLISSNTVTYKKSESRGYNRIGISYNSLKWGDSDSFSGVSLAWTKGISVSSSQPLYIETGIGATYAWGDYDLKFLSLTVPVNVTYKFDVAEGIRIAPYAGITLQGNIIGEIDGDDWFDEYDAKRFTVGWQIGSNFEFGKFFVGVGYGSAFTDIMEEGKQKTFNASLGLIF